MENRAIFERRLLAVLGSVTACSSFFLPWLTARGASNTYSRDALSIPFFPWFFLTLATLALIGILASTIFNKSALSTISTAIAVVIFLSPIVSIFSINVCAAWAAPSLLPSTFRRIFIGVTPGAGLWLALFGGLLLSISALDGASTFYLAARNSVNRLKEGDWGALAVALALTGAVLYQVSRYQSWVTLAVTTTTGSPERWPIPGFAIPVVGIISNFDIIVILCCAIWQFFRPSLGAATTLTVVGFAPLSYGVVGLCLRMIPSGTSFSIPKTIRSTVAQFAPTAQRLSNGYLSLPHLRSNAQANFQVNQGSIYCLVAGLCVSVAGIILIQTHKNERRVT